MEKIKKKEFRYHSKAQERYIDATFIYDSGIQLDTSIPITYRRTGTEIEDSKIDSYLEEVYDNVHPEKWEKWRQDQKQFWGEHRNAGVTFSFFQILAKDFRWCCRTCSMPQNPNFARRIQDIKEKGYTLSTYTNRQCLKCNKKTTQLILIPLPRGGVTGYETWSPNLRNRIIKQLGSFDAFEAKKKPKEGLLPDHKFPEIRWDNKTRRISLDNISDSGILKDFQLLTNQRNQQKREACRACYQTGKRGTVYGISFYYKGNEFWDKNFPNSGKEAEQGCVGCGWYDLNTWRKELNTRLNN